MYLPGTVAHTCNPSTLEAETGGLQVQGQSQEFSETLNSLVRPCFKIKKPGVVAHACNSSTWEAETGGSGFAASLSYLVRPSATS